jgi:hypothetical protein
MSPTRILTSALLSLGMLTGSFWLGFREGAEVGVMLDSVPRGGISLSYLNKVDQGITRNMVTGFESDVDLALLWAHRVEQHPLLPLLEPAWGLSMPRARESLARLAAYRATHPSPLGSQALALELSPEPPDGAVDRKALLASTKQNEQIIASMVQKYAPRVLPAK